jgi:ribosomal protein S18 acetylase RimI-like enzyme
MEQKHLATCADVFVTAFDSTPWNEKWDVDDAKTRLEEMYRTPGARGLIAISDTGEILGFALGHTEQWQRGKKHFYLKEMCVLPAYQRQKLGTDLMQVLCSDLVKEGVEAIYLLTSQKSHAKTFYKRLEFDTNSEMIMMGKYLKESDIRS